MMNIETFRKSIRYYLPLTNRTQKDLARAVGLSYFVLSNKLNGTKNSYLTYPEVKSIVKVLVEWGALSWQSEAQELLTMAGCPDFVADEWETPPLNRLQAVVHANGSMPVTPQVAAHGSKTAPLTLVDRPHDHPNDPPEQSSQRQSWGEAVDVSTFYGREQELDRLEHSVLADHCRLIAILGLGGIGKTTLSIKLTQRIEHAFDFVAWHSLQHAPTLSALLGNCIAFFSGQQQIEPLEDVNERITLLLDYFRQYRCLLVLDNMETVLQHNDQAGRYRAGYEEYGKFLRLVAQTTHQSCLVVTSREKPVELIPFEGKTSPVRAVVLNGLEVAACQHILHNVGLFGPEEAHQALIQSYGGNPLALKLGAGVIREVFGGDIAAFLREGEVFFGGVNVLLEQQVERLSPLGQSLLTWLAIERGPVTLGELSEEMFPPVPRRMIIEALEDLKRRSLLEHGDISATFTLQPMVMEYITERVVEQAAQELVANAEPHLWLSHSFMKAQARDDVRQSQEKFILEPLRARLSAQPGSAEGVETQLKQMLANLRLKPALKQGYGAGNVANLLYQVKGTLRGVDFSQLTIWQAYFMGVELQDANFAGASVARSLFSETFSALFSVAWSPDGTLLAGGSVNGEIRVWQAEDLKPLMTLNEHAGWVWSVAFNPVSSLLASGGDDGAIKIWNVQTGRCLKTLHAHTRTVRSVAFNPEGTQLASGGDDGLICLYDVESDEYRYLHGHTNWVGAVAFSPSQPLLASGGGDMTLRLWNSETGQCMSVLQGHSDGIRSMAFRPDGSQVISGGDDWTMRLWDIQTGQCLKILQGHSGRIWSVAFHPSSLQVVSSSDDRTLRLWDAQTGQCLKILQGHSGRVLSTAFNPDGLQLVSGSDDWTMRLWSVETGNYLKVLCGYDTWVTSISFSPDGLSLLSSNVDRTIRIWEAKSGQQLKTLRGHTGWVGAATFSPSGTLIASGSRDCTVKLWEARSGECIETLRGHSDWVGTVAFNPCSTLLASGSHDRTIMLWDVATKRRVTMLAGHTDWVVSVAFHPAGKLLASGSYDKTIKLWNIEDGRCLQTLEGHGDRVRAVIFSPDGKLLASGSYDKTIKLWNVEDGRCLQTLEGHGDRVRTVKFSPDGLLLASGNDDGDVRIWEVAIGTCLYTLHEHTNRTWSVDFSPDGATLVSGSEDRTIAFYNVQTGCCFKTLKNRLYERMDITQMKGLTEAQRETLRTLGAHEQK